MHRAAANGYKVDSHKMVSGFKLQVTGFKLIIFDCKLYFFISSKDTFSDAEFISIVIHQLRQE
jgi:hypothetical protein